VGFNLATLLHNILLPSESKFRLRPFARLQQFFAETNQGNPLAPEGDQLRLTLLPLILFPDAGVDEGHVPFLPIWNWSGHRNNLLPGNPLSVTAKKKRDHC
jgi:hypothetical protein